MEEIGGLRLGMGKGFGGGVRGREVVEEVGEEIGRGRGGYKEMGWRFDVHTDNYRIQCQDAKEDVQGLLWWVENEDISGQGLVCETHAPSS